MKVNKIDINAFREGIESDLYSQLPEYLEYINEQQPLDVSDTRDNIVLQKETEVDVKQTNKSVDLLIDMNTDYAEFRNEVNHLNPDKLGYIEKTLEKGVDMVQDIDMAKYVRVK
jgi:uncharacterized protein YllA (UPF0747 family)